MKVCIDSNYAAILVLLCIIFDYFALAHYTLGILVVAFIAILYTIFLIVTKKITWVK